MRVSRLCEFLLVVAVSAIFWTDAYGKSIKDEKDAKNLRIVHGDEVTPHSMPYMAAIRTIIDERPFLCGGSLVTNSLILTAARCVSGATEATITLGAHNIDELEESQLTFNSSEFIIHEEYLQNETTHNIALIVLPSAVTLNENVRTIELPRMDDILHDYSDEMGLVAGWGKAKDTDATTSSVLRYIQVTIIPTLICELPYLLSIGTDQMCTTGVELKNICLGDTGSPLIVDGVQAGIALFGSDFGCEVGFPGVYTKLTSYLPWLLIGVERYGEKN